MLKHLSFLTLLLGIYSHSISASSLRVSAEELTTLSAGGGVIILDVRSKNDYEVGHIKNSINFPVALTYYNKKVNGKIQKPQLMQKYLKERGIDTRSKIVIYDEGGLVSAARVFWALEVYGLTQIQILDRGYKYWRHKNLATSQSIPKIKPSQYIAKINHKRLASKFATQLAINNKNKVVIDARSLPAYQGKVSVAKRFGHIPGAISVPFEENIVENSEFESLKPINELQDLYADIPEDKKVIIYCKIGLVSTTNYFALRELGYDVANYDASWREWGNDSSLPIEK